MQSRIMKLAALTIILVMMIPACGPKGPAPTPTACTPVEVRWFVGLGTGTDPAQVEAENKIVEDFNKTHPCIKLVIEIVNYESARDTLATELASGNPPDIVGPVGVSGAEAFHGMWLDLTPLIESSGYDVNQFDKGAVDFYKVGGEGQIGLPFAIFPSMLYYQRDMFDEAGLNYPPHKYGEKYVMPDGTEAEWNYDTLRQLAMLLTVDINGKDATSPDFDPTQIVQYGYEPQYQDLRAIGSYWGADTFLDADGKTVRIPPQWDAAWKWVYNGVWVDHFIPTQAVRDSAEYASANPFDSGKVAMAITHLWYVCCIFEAGENWDIAAVPSYNGKTTSNFNADTFRILKASQHPSEAFEVVQYLIGDVSMELLAQYGGMPARAKDQTAFFDGLKETFPWDIDWQVAIDGIAYADNPSFEGYMPSYQEAFDYTNTFLNKFLTTEGLNMDEEIANFKAELQVIFNKQ
jgi:multiple sugar transport system substrate-binding protein